MGTFVQIGKKGYTLLELMIVVAIVGILVALAIPNFQHSAMKAKETALKQNLFTMRAVLDQYYADRGDYPESLESLVEAKYLRAIPPVNSIFNKVSRVLGYPVIPVSSLQDS